MKTIDIAIDVDGTIVRVCSYCQEGIPQPCTFYVNGDDCDCMDNDHEVEGD